MRAMETTTTSNHRQEVTADHVARFLIKLAHDERKRLESDAGNDPFKESLQHDDITPLKLQKMLYFAQAAHLAVEDSPLFDDEIQAWNLGPVVYRVYKQFESYRGNELPESEGSDEFIADDVAEFLFQVWQEFGKYSAKELVEITHRHKPWKDAFNPDNPTQTISQEAIKNFYKSKFAPMRNEKRVSS